MAERPNSSGGLENPVSGDEQKHPFEGFPPPTDADLDFDDNNFIRVAIQESVLGQQARYDDEHRATVESQG